MCTHRPQVPQQDNHCDCGVYVLEYIERFSQEFTKPGSVSVREWTDEQSKDWFKKKDIKSKRAQIMGLLDRLHAEYRGTTGGAIWPSSTEEEFRQDNHSRHDNGEEEELQKGGNEGAAEMCKGGQTRHLSSDDDMRISPTNRGDDYMSSTITSMQYQHNEGEKDEQTYSREDHIMQDYADFPIQNKRRRRNKDDDQGQEIT
jgi:hypothetical protein